MSVSPVWLTTQNHSTLVTERSAVPFLPVNPEYSATRNQVKIQTLLHTSTCCADNHRWHAYTFVLWILFACRWWHIWEKEDARRKEKNRALWYLRQLDRVYVWGLGGGLRMSVKLTRDVPQLWKRREDVIHLCFSLSLALSSSPPSFARSLCVREKSQMSFYLVCPHLCGSLVFWLLTRAYTHTHTHRENTHMATFALPWLGSALWTETAVYLGTRRKMHRFRVELFTFLCLPKCSE